MLRKVVVIVGVFSLAACATQPPPAMVWIRTDGQQIKGNPALEQQGEIDRTICLGDTQKTNLGSLSPVETSKYSYGISRQVEVQREGAVRDAMKGCMAQKGYMLVSADEADAMREQFAATAASRMAAANPPASPAKRR